ncbi:MAG: D-lyxose/D-mannose family sugar isomerase [Eubacteriales bacterium]|nr:D-lyxose/D-mannose family sugar isomerase [Eubacteriales bacterium]
MKRSEINHAIEYVMKKLEEAKFPLPPFAFYTPEDWKKADESEQEIVDNMLGWDVTDFGEGDFKNIGLTVFTFRNGNFHDKKKYPKPYAEKMLYVMDGQILPYHYHWYKGEDIINRGGGELEITLYNCSPEDFADQEGGRGGKQGTFLDTDVEAVIDGKKQTLPAGGKVILKPGQSISVKQGQYHTWQAVPGKGDIILFEVSMTNDDHVDNRFYEPKKRIPDVNEDEAVRHLMFADYKDYYLK